VTEVIRCGFQIESELRIVKSAPAPAEEYLTGAICGMAHCAVTKACQADEVIKSLPSPARLENVLQQAAICRREQRVRARSGHVSSSRDGLCPW
jgi:hypothetical protein